MEAIERENLHFCSSNLISYVWVKVAMRCMGKNVPELSLSLRNSPCFYVHRYIFNDFQTAEPYVYILAAIKWAS